MIGMQQSGTLAGLPLYRRGKVRDTYELGSELLVVATDRISAFDVVLPTPIPRKGIILTQLSRFWFERTQSLVPNHLLSHRMEDFPGALRAFGDVLAGRSLLVRKAERIDIECVVRGYLAGSAWAEYRAYGTIGGERMPAGWGQGKQLTEPLFTPAIKHDSGHDVTVSPAALARLVGAELAGELEKKSRALYQRGHEIAVERGIIVADTKFEFGVIDGRLTLIDELFTPDSSRFWDAASYRLGESPPGFDKQPIRDWLERSGWNKQAPAPALPGSLVAETAARYAEVFERLTGSSPWAALGEEERRYADERVIPAN